ncbi:hypothetical protein C942_03183 [Photobacterium marinum]|uniref:Chromosome segregation ATPase n=1 Tax=Photobacterium marinum TaxID=1056511 RepID=L8J9F7_9GAMM|nr:hypothetical protein [Photobacterium marinum]ELR64102.1 hypothetical protein C942_03183 [Photobacterium marinum]
MHFKYSVLAASMAAVLSVTGCNGSSSGNNTSTDGNKQPATLTQGKFIDAPVEGLYYVTKPSGKSGYTNHEGTYDLAEGDTITFYLGGEHGLRIGSTSARAITSPFEATGNYQKALNLARILQSMDNADDGAITLPDSIKAPGAAMLAALNEVQLHDMASATDLKKELNISDWVSEDKTLAHLNNSLKGLERGSKEVLTDWQRGSGKLFRYIDTTLTAQNSPTSEPSLYVQADKTLAPELFEATRGMSHLTFRFDKEHLAVLKGSNDSTLSESYAKYYLTCKAGNASNIFTHRESGFHECNSTQMVTTDNQFNLGNTFAYNLLSPEEVQTKDAQYPWDLLGFEGVFSCIANSSCSEASMTGFEIVEEDDSEEQDGSALQRNVNSNSYDAVTGIFTTVTKKTILSGMHKGRVSESLTFMYPIDDAEAERYVEFTGTWKAIETLPGCDEVAESTYVFNDKGATVSGARFYGDCAVMTVIAEPLSISYQELSDMDFWWFTTNGNGNDAKATLTQLNTTVRWCDDDNYQPGKACTNIKYNRWEYAPAGKNWDEGVLHRRTLDSNGNVVSTISFQKQ